MITLAVWDKIKSKAKLSEFEIHTVPRNKSIPLWFLVAVRENTLIIKKAKHHKPSVKLSMDRIITYKDFEFVYRCWLKAGAASRQEAAKTSQNTAYIFALIAEVAKEKEYA